MIIFTKKYLFINCLFAADLKKYGRKKEDNKDEFK